MQPCCQRCSGSFLYVSLVVDVLQTASQAFMHEHGIIPRLRARAFLGHLHAVVRDKDYLAIRSLFGRSHALFNLKLGSLT